MLLCERHVLLMLLRRRLRVARPLRVTPPFEPSTVALVCRERAVQQVGRYLALRSYSSGFLVTGSRAERCFSGRNRHRSPVVLHDFLCVMPLIE
jgi:hypothetical protein